MNFLSLLSPTSILAGIVIALSLSNALFVHLYNGAKDELTTYRTEVNAAQAQIEANTQRLLRESAAVNSDTAARLDVALRDLRKRSPIRVRQADCYTGGGLTFPKPAAGTDAAPAAPSADTEIILTAIQCEAELIKGIEDATRLSWLQAWINQQIEVSK
jgi:hypothetical protein